MDYPTEKNSFLVEHVLDIRNSYRQLLLKELISDLQSDEQFATHIAWRWKYFRAFLCM